jgi:hypothetical protein
MERQRLLRRMGVVPANSGLCRCAGIAENVI